MTWEVDGWEAWLRASWRLPEKRVCGEGRGLSKRFLERMEMHLGRIEGRGGEDREDTVCDRRLSKLLSHEHGRLDTEMFVQYW